MKRPLLLLLVLGLALAAAPAAPKGKYSRIGELPGEKVPEVLQPRERNPFTRREAKSTTPVVEEASEESKIRERLATMNVTGVVRGGDGTTVLLENLILKPGHPIPPLIDNQTEHLAVGRISDTQVELVFVEKDAHAEPRRILIPIDLRPRVSVRLGKPAAAKSSPP